MFCPLLPILIYNSQVLAHLVLIYSHVLQVLLHDPVEEPQMKDLAFAVSPGSQTLAAIKHTKVSPQPHCLFEIKHLQIKALQLISD